MILNYVISTVFSANVGKISDTMRAKDASGHNLGAVHVLKECHLAVADVWYYKPDGSTASEEARKNVYVFDLKVSATLLCGPFP